MHVRKAKRNVEKVERKQVKEIIRHIRSEIKRQSERGDSFVHISYVGRYFNGKQIKMIHDYLQKLSRKGFDVDIKSDTQFTIRWF